MRPSVFATPHVMGRTTGVLAIIASALGLVLALTMPLAPTTPYSYIAVVAAFAIGVFMLVWGDRLSRGHYEVMVWVAIVLVTFGDRAGSSPIGAIATACDYALVAALAGFFFEFFRAMLQIVVIAFCCVVVLAVRPELPWWIGLCGASVSVMTGVTVLVMGRLASAAEIDSLTGLFNRRGFDRKLEQALGAAVRHGGSPVLLLFDIDRFQAINEARGHAGGDDALRDIAKAARKLIARTDVFARYGGDEFAVLSTTMTEHDAIALSEQIREAIPTGCSAGVTSWQKGESASYLVSRADIALYQAKRAGRNRTKLESGKWPPLAQELRDAIEQDSLDVHYQPIVRTSDRSVVGVEALLRWQSVTRPDVKADEIIRIAEDNDLIAVLDNCVLSRACRDAKLLRGALGADMSLNVNVSGLELAACGYVDSVLDVLADTGWPAAQLILEVTETALEADTETAVANLRALRERGIRIAIDDFGTGFSSLGRLTELPTDMLKLDADFIAGVTATSAAPRLLSAVAAIGVALGLPVTAEGVEDEYQAAAVAALGFQYAQGFFYARPQPAAALIAIADELRVTERLDH
ncbi:bifunctional diguanylate cyclase/phosphodiesterase [Antrihabitans sp. YC2-6]|uniref:putative bifunctional diguanylate cyclase/phosphodiesterase n=1 Tax=Antrihabitans sp. YC2-6 TaxID=2799498 RepID=UPI0018F558C6|nr:bifunctional diguanylate cyclase/phosphodiesterase [Antrihabitans sp. YC2-6]MBJ8343788.1 EAL domain-containing protein [Antrihabitans sp. YC2-6]